jgi:hypothetical protein
MLYLKLSPIAGVGASSGFRRKKQSLRSIDLISGFFLSSLIALGTLSLRSISLLLFLYTCGKNQSSRRDSETWRLRGCRRWVRAGGGTGLGNCVNWGGNSMKPGCAMFQKLNWISSH